MSLFATLLLLTVAVADITILGQALYGDESTAARISTLTTGLKARSNDRTDPDLHDRYARLARDIHREVDRFVFSRINRAEAPQRVQARLRLILRDHNPNPEYADLPIATAGNV